MRALRHCRFIRAVGFDDGPFPRAAGARVPLVGAVCSGTRFEGMVFGHVRKDGWNATDEIVRLLDGRKFLPQLHLVLLDGIAFGGFNVVDLDALARTLGRPCVAVMRRPPDMAAIRRALSRLASADRRFNRMKQAGPIHQRQGFVFQVVGGDAGEVGDALVRITDTGRVPEALRVAHLIGSALVTGESGRRA
jgi:endonuclease V-like protein UPF0215 family